MPRRLALVLTVLIASAGISCGSNNPPPQAVGPGNDTTGTAPPGSGDCSWPMWGQNIARSFSYPCPTTISPATVKDLEQRWFFPAHDVVTASPAVVGGTVYVGDWSGAFYAIDAETGAQKWMFQVDIATNVYAGQIVSSAAVADVGGTSTVYFAAGPVLYALRAGDGTLRWKTNIGTGGDSDFTEIESSPVVVDGKVIFGSDVHNHEDQKAGVYALDAADGHLVWMYDPDEGQPGSGCVDVWGSVAIDTGRKGVYFGTGSCDTVGMRWRPTSEAIIAVDLGTGARRWAYQPHSASRDDLDYAGAPNLFEANGKALVGLGNKDGTYYAVDRDSGALAWKSGATTGGRTGGFIGPTVYARGIIAGGTAVGDAPFLHGIDATDGRIIWQQPKPQATYAASAEANGVLFIGGNDFTFRAVDLKSGDILWSKELPGAVAGGAAIVGDDVFAVDGIREPGLDKRSETSGVYRFSLRKAGGPATTTTAPASTTSAKPVAVGLTNAPGSQECIGSSCKMGFLKGVPDGLAPTATILIEPDPLRITLTTSGMGDPKEWITPGTDAAAAGATTFALFASESDDNPVGGLLCVLDGSGACSTEALPRLATYNRLTILAVTDTSKMPTPADGLARLVATTSFSPSLTPTGLPPTSSTTAP